MHCDGLISNFKDPKTIALVKENIRHIPDGSLSHCAGALNLVFRKAFELKMKKREPPGVRLRCPISHCSWNRNNLPYSSVGSTPAHCPYCANWRYKQCSGCGYDRTGSFPSCQGCGKVFL